MCALTIILYVLTMYVKIARSEASAVCVSKSADYSNRTHSAVRRTPVGDRALLPAGASLTPTCTTSNSVLYYSTVGTILFHSKHTTLPHNIIYSESLLPQPTI